MMSSKDKKHLAILAAAALFALSVLFVFWPQLEKAGQIEKENEKLAVKLTQLKQIEQKQNEYRQDAERMQQSFSSLMSAFPSEVREEDGIALALEMERLFPIEISSVSMGEGELAADGADLGNKGNEPSIWEEENAPAVSLYKTLNSYEYRTDYKNLKKMLDYLQRDGTRRSIDSLSASFDTSTGYIFGTLNLNFYYITGAEKEYEQPDVPQAQVGLLDPFKALEKPEADKK